MNPSALRLIQTPQPALPIDRPTWDCFTFARRCLLTRVGDPVAKMLYLSLALLAQPLVKADHGWFRMRRENILHGVEMGERRYYYLVAKLKRLGLVQTRRTAKATYYRVFARQDLAVAPPFVVEDGFRQMGLPEPVLKR